MRVPALTGPLGDQEQQHRCSTSDCWKHFHRHPVMGKTLAVTANVVSPSKRQVPGYGVQRDSACVCEAVSGWDSHCSLQTEQSECTPQWVGLLRSSEGLNRQKVCGQENAFSLPVSPELAHRSPPAFKCGLRLKPHQGLPGSPAGQLQIWDVQPL